MIRAMANQKHVNMLLGSNPGVFNKWRKDNPNETPDFSGHTFVNFDFIKFNLSIACFVETTLKSCKFFEADLTGANFTRATLENVSFNKSEISLLIFTGASLDTCQFIKRELTEADFIGATLTKVKLNNLNLTMTKFSHANLETCGFSNSNLTGASFNGATLKNAHFTGATLDKATFRDCKTNETTEFTHLKSCDKCTMDNITLALLGDNRGGLTVGNLIKMNIVSDLKTLKLQFGGYLRWFHAIALIGFFFPYIWLLVTAWLRIHFFTTPDTDGLTVPVITLLCRYITSGGAFDNWETEWHWGYSFMFFCVALLYNILRLSLFLKTQTLTHQEDVKGYPVDFSLDSRIRIEFKKWKLNISFELCQWNTFYKLMRKVMWFYLIVVFFHTVLFLLLPVPLGLD